MTPSNFIIAGGRKCATTSFYHWINQHPQICMYPKTDTTYFIDDVLVGRKEWLDGKINTQEWDKNHSLEDYRKRFTCNKEVKVIGEKSADLFFWKEAHSRVAKLLPDCKFIVVLRNPIKRAWSQYWDEIRKGREQIDFDEAIASEVERTLKSDYARHHLSYISSGFYDECLYSLLKYFPKENIHVILLEETRSDLKQTLKDIFSFLGVDPEVEIDIKLDDWQKNTNATLINRDWVKTAPGRILENVYSRLLNRYTKFLWKGDQDISSKRRVFYKKAYYLFKKPAAEIQLSTEQFHVLSEIFRPHITSLEQLIGKDLSCWRLNNNYVGKSRANS